MNVLQDWVVELPMMQQSVLMAAVRGPDGVTKYHPSKYMLRWYRRCVLLSAMDGRVLEDPVELNGGSFTGPSVASSDDGCCAYSALGLSDPPQRRTWSQALDDLVSEYLRSLDELPHHFQLHFMHAVEILGYKHPDPAVRRWWLLVYQRLVLDMHLTPETESALDYRLGDSRAQWLDVADPATRT